MANGSSNSPPDNGAPDPPAPAASASAPSVPVPGAPSRAAAKSTRPGTKKKQGLRKTYTGEATFSAAWAYASGRKQKVTSPPIKMIELDSSEPISITNLGEQGPKLGEWPATAICGNDITSSCLYVSALAIGVCGKLAPIALLMVAGVLYLFRKVYAEVGEALPLNGGAYNCLLNTTSKFRASIAACMTILSYMATAVISAGEAMHYAHNLVDFNTFTMTIVLLSVFAAIALYGIGESAIVAMIIFAFHMLTLTLLAILGIYHIITNPEVLANNWALEPELVVRGTRFTNLGLLLIFGFCTSLLGTSGFESSANFIEEQDEGVFPKTLRNMWIAVSVFNPLMCLIVLSIIPIPEIGDHSEDALAYAGELLGGGWFGKFVSLDATLVLCGAVLTSFVGVTGLVRRMALDRVLPALFLQTNKWRKTNHVIILSFLALCVSVHFITQGHISLLAGVYLVSFLGVMALFSFGNMLLKVKRGRLRRTIRASWPAVLVATFAVITGLVVNVYREPEYLKVFAVYFAPTMSVIAVMFLRNHVLKLVLYIGRELVDRVAAVNTRISNWARTRYEEIHSQSIIFFTRGDDAANLNRAMLYVRTNEHTDTIRVVHVYRDKTKIPETLARDIKFLDDVYPEIHIEFIAVKGSFGPELIERLSQKFGVPRNYMFIGCPGDTFPLNIAQLGGVRLIV
jgi:amino acid transporter